jgi:hypothetical protein
MKITTKTRADERPGVGFRFYKGVIIGILIVLAVALIVRAAHADEVVIPTAAAVHVGPHPTPPKSTLVSGPVYSLPHKG